MAYIKRLNISLKVLVCAFLALINSVPQISSPAYSQISPPSKAQQDPSKSARLSRVERLDGLYATLRMAENPKAASVIAEQIERIWEHSGSNTADIMLQRAKKAIEQKNYDLALDLLDHLIPLKPDWAEVYHRRAVVFFLIKDEDSAMRDLRTVLAKDPNHFQALAGLGLLLQRTGNEKAAFAAFSRAVEVHPYLEDLAEKVTKMRDMIEGQPI